MQRKRMNSKICGLWIISISLRRLSLLLLIALKSYKQPLYHSPFSSFSIYSPSHLFFHRPFTLFPSPLLSFSFPLPSFSLPFPDASLSTLPQSPFVLLSSFSFFLSSSLFFIAQARVEVHKQVSKSTLVQILFSTSSFRILLSLFSNLALHLLSSRH